jgi:alpha-L-fucosidase
MKTLIRTLSLVASLLVSAQFARAITPEEHQRQLGKLLTTLEENIARGPYEPTVESLNRYSAPDWYADAKLGIFIHYGLFSVPACPRRGCWYGNFMHRGGHPVQQFHLERHGPLDEFGYKDFASLLTGSEFKADEWVDLCKQAGARFVVPVSCFHDGYAMWDSKLTDWNCVKTGPKFDYDGLLAAAARKQGLKFGVAWHAFFRPAFFGPGRHPGTDIQPPNSGPPWSFYGPDRVTPEFVDDCLGRLVELVDGYQPDLVWFDFDTKEVDRTVLRRFASFYFNRAAQWGKPVAINDKSEDRFPPQSIVLDYERGKTSVMRPKLWQTDTSVSWKDWSHMATDSFKKADDLILELVDIVSKNGVLLLNIGPRADGSIPPEPTALLRAIGVWLGVNGEAIYGTRPCWALGFGEGSSNSGGGGFSDRAIRYNSNDFRFTQKGGTIHAIAMGWPEKEEEILIKSFNDRVTVATGGIAKVELLGSGEPLKWRLTAEGLRIIKPSRRPTQTGSVFKIATSGVCLEQLDVRRLDAQEIQLEVRLRNLDAEVAKHQVSFFANQKPLGSETFALNGRSTVSRTVVLTHPGIEAIETISAAITGAKPFVLQSQLANPVSAGDGYKFDQSFTLASGGLGKLESFTISCWVRTDGLRERGTWLFNTVAEKAPGVHLLYTAEGFVQLRLWNGDGAEARVQTTATPGLGDGWHHLAASYDGSTHTASIYLNGELAAQGPADRQAASDFGAFTLGGGRAEDRRFAGQLADVRIYQRSLPQAEINEVLRGRAIGVGPEAAWNFKQRDAKRIPDVSGHNHHLTVEE